MGARVLCEAEEPMGALVAAPGSPLYGSRRLGPHCAMFYQPAKRNHGLPRDPLKSCVVPRPIGWISTLSSDGVANLAPYSFFNMVASEPAIVMFSSCGVTRYGNKDTVTNVEATRQFVVNLADWSHFGAMIATSDVLPPEADEFEHAGLSKEQSVLVRPPRVAGVPIHLECEYLQTVELPHEPGGRNALVLGKVLGVHIDDRVLVNGLVDVTLLQPMARLGYQDYARVDVALPMPPR